MNPHKTTVALVDDHVLLRNGLASLVNSFKGFEVLFEADHGKDLIQQLQDGDIPDIILLDIFMPEMNGFETLAWLKANMPDIKVIMVSMNDDDSAVVRCIKDNARAYLLKDSKPEDFFLALTDVRDNGFFLNQLVNSKMFKFLRGERDPTDNLAYPLTEKEEEFIKLACTDLTYKKIAEQMKLSPRTIDGYREDLFRKLNLVSRVGLVIYAIKRGLFKVE